jgi:TRAP-type C4-dicarboxylate transport system permease small subunit
MKIILVAAYIHCCTFSFIFAIIGWQGYMANFQSISPAFRSVVIPAALGFGTIVLPYYLNPLPEMIARLKARNEAGEKRNAR